MIRAPFDDFWLLRATGRPTLTRSALTAGPKVTADHHGRVSRRPIPHRASASGLSRFALALAGTLKTSRIDTLPVTLDRFKPELQDDTRRIVVFRIDTHD